MQLFTVAVRSVNICFVVIGVYIITTSFRTLINRLAIVSAIDGTSIGDFILFTTGGCIK